MLPKLLDYPGTPGRFQTPYEIYNSEEQGILRQLQAGILPPAVGDYQFVFDQGELTAQGATPIVRFTGTWANEQVPIAAQTEDSLEHDAGHVLDIRYLLSIPEAAGMMQRASSKSVGYIDNCKLFAKATDNLADCLYSLRTGWATESTLDVAREALSTLIDLAEFDPKAGQELYELLDNKLGLKEIESYAHPHTAALGHLAAGNYTAMRTEYDGRVKQAAEFLARGIIPPLQGDYAFDPHPRAVDSQDLIEALRNWKIIVPGHRSIPAYQWLLSNYDTGGMISQIVLNPNMTPGAEVRFSRIFQSLGESSQRLLSGDTRNAAGSLAAMRDTLSQLTDMSRSAGYPDSPNDFEKDYMLNKFAEAIKFQRDGRAAS